MGLKKGQTNNPNGQPTDQKVKLLRDALRSRMLDEERIKKLFECLDGLEKRYYIEYYLRIFKEIVPPLTAELEQQQSFQSSVRSLYEIFEEARSRNKAS